VLGYRPDRIAELARQGAVVDPNLSTPGSPSDPLAGTPSGE
jgi:hypothetical protein